MITILQYITGILAIAASYFYGYTKGLRTIIKTKYGISDKVLDNVRPSKIKLFAKKQPLPEHIQRVKDFENKL